MNSNVDDDGGHPNNNGANDLNQRNNHSPYFSAGESHGADQISSPATSNASVNREAVNWEATAALLGGSARSPGVAGIYKGSASHNMMMEDDDNDMQNKLPSKAQHPDVQLIPGVESNRPLPPMQKSLQLNQQQLHHHPDLPFLVTNWIAHYNALQSNNSATLSTDYEVFGNNINELSSNKTHEQKAKEEEARRLIQRAAADLAWSFQTLGAFGTTNTNTSSTLSRPATYSDMARKFAPLLATSTTTDSGQNENQSVALLDSLVASSSLTTAEATKNVLENRMPRSFLEAAYEGTVPGEGSCLINDNISSFTGTNQSKNNDESTSQGRRVGVSTLSSIDANASLEYLVPKNESSGSAMQNPVLLNSNITGLAAVNSRTTAVQAGEASRKYISLRNKAIDQQKEIDSAREALTAAVTRAENSGPLSSVAARRSANSPTKQTEFDTESDLDHHRVVAQLQRRVAELNLNFSVTRGDVLDAKRKADSAWAEVVSLQKRYHDPYQQNAISSSVNVSLRKMGIRSLLHGNHNSVLPKELSQECFGHKNHSHHSLQLENQLSLLKSRLSHAITMSCHLIYPVYCLRFDKTGKYFITGADDQIVKVFHLGAGPKKAQDGEERTFSYGANVHGAVLVCTLRGHAGVVADIDVSSDNSLLATASGDGDVRIWGLRDGCPVAILRGHRDGANMVSWSTLSPFRLVTCGENGLARMWDVRNAALKRYGDMIGDRSDYVLPTQNKSKSSPDQQNSEGDSETNGDELRQNVPPLPQRSEGNESNGNNVVIPPLPPAAGGIGPIGNAGNAANENRVNVGDFVAGDAIDEGVELIAQLQHGNLVNDSQLQGAGTRARRKAVKVMCIARCPIGGHFATGSDDGLGRIWADEDDKRVEILDREHREGSNKLNNNDPLFIRSLTGRQQAVLGSSTAPSKERLLATLSGHNNPITDMMYSNAGDRILTASQKDGVVRIWSWSKENTIIIDGQTSNASISDFQSGARQTKFSNLSQVMIRLTPVTRGETTSSNAARRKAPSSSVSQSVNCDGVTWTCDDMKVVTSQSSPLKAASTEITPGSQMIYVWDSHTGKCLMGISSSHTSMCSVLVPHPKLQSLIVSAGADGQVNVWDLERGQRFCTHSNKLLHGPIAETSSRGKQCGYLEGQFSPDGLTLVLTDENGRVSIFDTLAAADDIRNKSVPALPLWMAEQYFANDYYDLFYDSNGYCIERGSEQPPHLAPKGARCTHEGVSYSEEVRITYADIEGPSPLPEDVVRWHRDDIRAQSLSIRRDGGMLAQSSHKKATLMVESPGLLSDCKTTAIIGTDGKIINLDRKESSSRKDTRNQFGSRNANSSRLSSRYRWFDFNDLSDEEIDLEDADDEDFQLSSGRRTSRQNNLQNESSEEEDFDDVEILDDSPQRRRQPNNGQRRDRRQNRRRDRSVLFEESNEPVRASSRTVSRRTYEEMDSDDEQLNEVMSTHTKPSGEYYEDWTVSQHFFKMPRGEGAGIHRKWASRTSRSEKTWWKKMYCPQVGDSVIYIPRAHYDTMQKFPIASYVGPWKSWPQYSPWPVVCCRVSHIRYRFPYEMYHRSRRKDEKLEGVAAVLTLEITGVPAQSNDRNCPWPSPNFVAPIATRTRSHELTSTFEVTVFENVPTEFIMPQFLYTWKIRALESAIQENDGIVGGIAVSLQCVPDQNESGRVIEDLNHEVYKGTLTDMNWQDEREFHFECSGYNALSLQWDLEDGTQEVIPACPWDITVDHTEPPQVPSLSKETKTQLLSSLKEVMEMDDQIREWFYLHVDTTHYTDYLDMIEVPMYISLIQSRLRNNYYTNKYSVLSDVELIKDNCYKYNEDNNEFYDAACQMYEKFKTLVDAIETPEEELTTFPTPVQEPRTRNRAAPTSPSRTNSAEASKRSTRRRESNYRSQNDETESSSRSRSTRRSTRGQPVIPASNYRSQNDEIESSSRSRSTRRSTRGQPVIPGNQSEEEEVNDIDEDDYAEEVSNRRVSPRRSTRSQPKEPSSSESEEEVDEIDEDDYNEDVSPTTRRSTRGKPKISNAEESDNMEVDESEEEIPPRRTSPRRSTRGKPKESSSSESEVEDEDAYESEEEVSPRRMSSRRSTRGGPKKPSSSESEEEVDEVEQEEYEEEASPRRSTRRKTSDFKAEREEPKPRTTSRRSNPKTNVEKEPESPSRKSSRTRATKPSYIEKNSDDEEWAEDDQFEDSDDDDVSSDEEVRGKRQKKNSRGAPAAKKFRSGYNYYPDLAKWPPVSRRKINRLGTTVIQKVRKLDTWEMFVAPVCEAFPEVADDYKAIVTEPMDLRTIEEERLPTYGRIDELQQDLILTLKNCCVFNGEGSDYYCYAVEIWHSLNDVFKEACEEEGVMLPPRFI